MKNGQMVAAFEREFAQYVGAKYAIALCNGTATLHTALVALGVKPGDRVATTPLTMSATSIAVLQAGAVPVYSDVNERTWIAGLFGMQEVGLTVSLYGLSSPMARLNGIDDAAQTLRKHNPDSAFTSYSFQASKILALGEGGMLVTDSEELATKARAFSSLGYRMTAGQPRIDPNVLKSPDYARHHSLGFNYRMNDLTAEAGLKQLAWAEFAVSRRREAAGYYREAIAGCSWITPQFVPEGWSHDYWCYSVALESKELWEPFTQAVVRHGGEMPYGAWRLTYNEPAFRHLNPPYLHVDDYGTYEKRPHAYPCPVAEDLQPRLCQFQTNNLESAQRNAKAVKEAIRDVEDRGLADELTKLHGRPQSDFGKGGTFCQRNNVLNEREGTSDAVWESPFDSSEASAHT